MCTPAAFPRTWSPAALLAPLLLAATCAGLPACGGDDDGGDDPDAGMADVDGAPDDPDGGPPALGPACEGASGTRLRQVLREHGDGTSEFLRLLDTDLVEECRFQRAVDGSLRCLPVADGTPVADAAIRYLDAECAQPVAQLAAPAADPEPTLAREVVLSEDACTPSSSRFYQLGARAAIAPETAIFFRDAGGVCTGTVAPVADFFALGAELEPAAFVEGTESFTDSGRVQERQVEGDDGSLFCDRGTLRDAELDHACSAQLSEDGSTRCLPVDVGPTEVFGDAACAEPLEVALLGECNQDAVYVGNSAGASCALRQQVRTVDDPVDAFQLVAKVCTAIAEPQAARAIGSTISPFSFAGLASESVAVAGARLERRDLVSGEFRLATTEWFDTMLETPCAFRLASDGDDRCLPLEGATALAARVVGRFTDAACTVPIDLVTRDESCLAGAPTYALQAIGGGRFRVREVGEVQPGPIYRQGVACEEEPADRVHYLPGDEILPQTFLGGTETIE